MEYTEGLESVAFEDLLDLYKNLNWTHYAQDEAGLKSALKNSTYIALAIEFKKPVALLRSLSDDFSIHYIQDILVTPAFQRKGVGKKLMMMALKRFNHVRTHVLLTDDEEKQKLFYKSVGFKNTKELKKHTLNAFVKIRNTELL